MADKLVPICPAIRSSVLANSNKFHFQKKKSCKSSASYPKYGKHLNNARSLTNATVEATYSGIAVKETNGSVVLSPRKGLGMIEFLEAKNFLVTGATGFLGKVVIEKILRAQPGVGKLFLIIKANDLESALQRLKNEIIYSELFRCLRDMYGDEYETFVLEKLVPVVGDVSVDNLGIQADVSDKLVEQADIILNLAANTAFDERYDVSLETNTKGPSRLMEFGRRCKKLQLFLHISTAYVSGKRVGLIREQPFHMGDSIARELEGEAVKSLDISEEFKLAKTTLGNLLKEMKESKSNKDLNDAHHIVHMMKDLGLERARRHGWDDVYTFTKSMGEMLLDSNRGQIPLAIVRPSVIEGTYSDPFPGWIEGLRMVDPIIAYYGKGRLFAVVGDPQVAFDIVPADMVANAIIAAMAKHAGKPGLDVYHVASSVANPITLGDLFEMFSEHFKSYPYVDATGNFIPVNDKIELFRNMEDLSFHVENNVRNGLSSAQIGKRERIALRLRERINKKIGRVYQHYFTYPGRFDNSKTQRLFQELSKEEKKLFGFDVNVIEWRDYVMNIHIPGLRRSNNSF